MQLHRTFPVQPKNVTFEAQLKFVAAYNCSRLIALNPSEIRNFGKWNCKFRDYALALPCTRLADGRPCFLLSPPCVTRETRAVPPAEAPCGKPGSRCSDRPWLFREHPCPFTHQSSSDPRAGRHVTHSRDLPTPLPYPTRM